MFPTTTISLVEIPGAISFVGRGLKDWSGGDVEDEYCGMAIN